MNSRQGMLVTGFFTTLFMNFASTYWTMWSVASISLFTLMITDFMFFAVRSRARAAPPPGGAPGACSPCARCLSVRAGQRVLVTRRETLVACSLILPMRAASGGGFSSVLAARGRERREDTQHAHIDILAKDNLRSCYSGVRYSCAF